MADTPKRRSPQDNSIDLDGASPPGPNKGERAYSETIRSRYFIEDKAENATFYRDYKGQELAFRLDRQGGRLVTKGEDIATVRDMLSVAESEGWKAVKLGGSQEFRREAWIEAATRDIEAQGYTPTDLDRQEAEKRRARRDRDDGPAPRNQAPTRGGDDDGPGKPSGPRSPQAPDSNVLSLEIEKAARTTRTVQRDEARLERDEVRLTEDQAGGRRGAVARDEARLQRDEARLGSDRARLSDAAQSILAAIGGRIDKEMSGLTGLEKEQLKDFTAGLLAAREQEVGRLQDPGPVPARYRRAPQEQAPERVSAPSREPEPEPLFPLPRRHRDRDAERTL